MEVTHFLRQRLSWPIGRPLLVKTSCYDHLKCCSFTQSRTFFITRPSILKSELMAAWLQLFWLLILMLFLSMPKLRNLVSQKIIASSGSRIWTYDFSVTSQPSSKPLDHNHSSLKREIGMKFLGCWSSSVRIFLIFGDFNEKLGFDRNKKLLDLGSKKKSNLNERRLDVERFFGSCQSR